MVRELAVLGLSSLISLSLALWRFAVGDTSDGFILLGVFLVALTSLGVAVVASRS